MTDAPVLLGDLVRRGARRLQAAEVSQPSREAWWIWERVSGQPRSQGVAQAAAPVSEGIVSGYTSALARRAAGEPLAHVLGETSFRHLTLRSDARALIPRPETEGLVDLVLQRQPTGRVADIGTGTGCIALSLASEGDFDQIVAVERSPAALELARSNIAAVGAPVSLIAGDLSRCLADSHFDVLVSNPPYLSDAEYDALDASVKSWEPVEALRSGVDGLDATRELLRDGLRVVRAGGWILLEVDCTRAAKAAEAATRAGWEDVLMQDDLFGRARYLVARRSE